MHKFLTESGSVYQVDDERNLIRRLSGSNDPTPRQGPDGEWKHFHKLRDDLVPGAIVIFWDETRCTMTSRVVRRLDVE